MANEKRLDLINKWDVVNKLIQLQNQYNFYKNEWDADVLYRRIVELEIGIGKTPTVDAVEVVHGEWKDAHEIKSFRHTNIPVVQCSKCECYFCDIINNHRWFYHYCPNCGAKMDGDGNG